MLIKAAEAIASVVTDDQLNANYIVPSVFQPDMAKTVAKAIVDCVPKAPAPKSAAKSAID